MKYCIVAGETAAQLATSTLFDLLGDPALWKENHEILIIGTDLPDWAQALVDEHHLSVAESMNLDSNWIVLGPTDEDTVRQATQHGAKYLALDDGLVELVLEEEEEVPTKPDIEEEPVAEIIDIPEIPATRKRDNTKAGSRRRHPAGKDAPTLDTAVDEAIALTQEVSTTMPDVDEWEQAAELTEAYLKGVADATPVPVGDVNGALKVLVAAYADKATDDVLWDMVSAARR